MRIYELTERIHSFLVYSESMETAVIQGECTSNQQEKVHHSTLHVHRVCDWKDFKRVMTGEGTLCLGLVVAWGAFIVQPASNDVFLS